MRTQPQLDVPVVHCLHGGMYHRTVRVPPGFLFVSVYIVPETIVTVHGHLSVWINGDWVTFEGFHVLPAAGGRKQVMLAHSETTISAVFPSTAKTVAEAEAEMTDTPHLLQSAGRTGDTVFNTHQEKPPCQE